MDERRELQLVYTRFSRRDKLSLEILDGLIVDTSASTWYVATEYCKKWRPPPSETDESPHIHPTIQQFSLLQAHTTFYANMSLLSP